MPRNLSFEERFERAMIPEPNSGCWLWTACVSPLGYGRIWYKGRQEMAHRASWEHRFGPIPDGMFACHRCDVPSCVNPDHLFLGTQQDNIADMVAKRRHAHGEKHGRLSEQTILQIRAAEGLQREIGERFSLSQQMVSAIKNRIKWSHL